MDRIPKGTSATIAATFYLDGVATDPSPDSADVEILREDGTVLVASTAATNAGSGKFTFDLTPTHGALLDRLTARWTATLNSQLQTVETIVEVVGGFLFSVPYARKLKPLDNETVYPTAEVLEARTFAETALEDACGVAFVPRYARDKVDGRGTTDIRTRRRPLSVIAASVDGVALTSDELADLELYPTGGIYRADGWSCGRRNVELKYIHGFEFPPPRVGRAARALAKWVLVESPLSDRTTRVTSEDGTAEFAIAAAGGFDIPEVNSVIERYGARGTRLA